MHANIKITTVAEIMKEAGHVEKAIDFLVIRDCQNSRILMIKIGVS